jgi:soluble lytic murein transglycosylase
MQKTVSLPGEVIEISNTPLVNAFEKARLGKWGEAYDEVFATGSNLGIKTYSWLYYINDVGKVDFRRISGFIENNPTWPKQRLLELRAEKSIPDDLDSGEVVRWFDNHKPQTIDGFERYLKAIQRTGEKKRASSVINDWWRITLLTPAKQKYFVRTYGYLISDKSHKARFDHLLFNRHYTNARAIANILGKGYLSLANARIALAEEKGGVDNLIARVPEKLRNDPGLLYERLRWRRRQGKIFSAMELLHNAPPVEEIPNLQDWWTERHIIARKLMENGQYASAYLLVDNHMQTNGLAFVQAEFLAGWLALTYMDKPWQAFERFESLYNKTSTPISRARGSYWAGRASDALGYPDIARKWYKIAARHQTVFYGQMAIATLEEEHKPPQQVPPKITTEGYSEFHNRELVIAARILDMAGLKNEAEDFLEELTISADNPETFRLAAEFAQDLGYRHNAVKIAKKAWKKNIFLVEQAYPTIISMLGDIDLEWALVHAVIRQESAFDYRAKSSAGAMGLMQLMPATAREMARKSRIPHRTSWLSSRPNHNIRLGTNYLEYLLDRFDGYYPLAFAAYNAGPTRVENWLKKSGDPRKGEISMIDWIEKFPIYETRNYVQRVMEGLYIYRLMLKDIQENVNSPIHVAMGYK